MEKIVIIGGGIAGLSCLNALVDQGVPALLLEGGEIGTPKMCGEFLAPSLTSQLAQWEIGPVHTINAVRLIAHEQQLNLKFTSPAGAMARSLAEINLAARARKNGARIREQTFIKHIVPASDNFPHVFYLTSGEEIYAETAIFATGKLNSSTIKSFPYYGIKFHFPHVVDPNRLFMFSLKNAYLGMVPISLEESNCACLIKHDLIKKFSSTKQLLQNLFHSNLLLKSIFSKIDLTQIVLLEGPVPAFQFKSIPPWKQSFWIGDALVSFHPAIGSGFSHSMESAMKAAFCYLNPRGSDLIFPEIKTKFIISTLMHQLLLHPNMSSFALSFAKVNTWLSFYLFKKLEY